MSLKLNLNEVDDMGTYVCESLIKTTCILLFYQYLVKILSEFTKNSKLYLNWCSKMLRLLLRSLLSFLINLCIVKKKKKKIDYNEHLENWYLIPLSCSSNATSCVGKCIHTQHALRSQAKQFAFFFLLTYYTWSVMWLMVSK